MGKLVDNTVLDAALDKIATGNQLSVCSADPVNYAGIAAVMLAEEVLTAGDGNGDYTIADGDGADGRKLTVASQPTMTVTNTGTATHICIDDGTTLLYQTTCTSQLINDTGTVTVPAWDITISDPT